MNIVNRFNLIDEPWLPILGEGLVSLNQLFSNSKYQALSGNSTQKIALTKLLLAIAQAAYTPVDDDDWITIGAEDLSKRCITYLEKWHDSFWLHGEKPFLQIPANANIKHHSFGKLMPSIATGNTTLLNQSQVEFMLDDSEKALLLIQLMGFGLGGKQVDNSTPLTPGYIGNKNSKGKVASGRAGRSAGYLHSFLLGQSVHETIHKNLLTHENINDLKYFSKGVGTPPWELMPIGEACDTALNLKNSYIGCLVPLCRFVYLQENCIHNSDGILYDRGTKQAPKRDPDPAITFDPMLTVDRSKKEATIQWANPEKRPWRELTSLLSYIQNSSSHKFCLHHSLCLTRVRKKYKEFSIWAGGLNFSDKAGEQAPRGTDDFVESKVNLKNEWFNDRNWLAQLNLELSELNKLSSMVYRATSNFFISQQMKKCRKQADMASNVFWQLCERKFQDLINACEDINEVKLIRNTFAQYVNRAYDTFCSKETARQLDAWAKNRPNLSSYLS